LRLNQDTRVRLGVLLVELVQVFDDFVERRRLAFP
jgi:hypothetical protein